MTEPTSYSIHDGIAVIGLDNPPVNGLGNALRAGIVQRLKQAEADPAARAAILIGSARVFSGGADIREFGKPMLPPSLPEVNDEQDRLSKPLVAAIGGLALGGGLELALACHYRIALPQAQLGLPEVKLGVLPGSGGTQRLPRLVDMAEAAQIMIGGNPITTERARELGLVDELAEGDLLEATLAYARRLLAEGRGPRRVRELEAKLAEGPGPFFARLRERVARDSRGYPAPLRIVDCLEAAVTRPFDEGRLVERDAFLALVESPESKALRHVFFAEREAAKIPDVPDDTPLRDIRQAAVVGAGTMGGGIAMSLVGAGLPVTLIEAQPEALERGLATIARNYAASVAKGRLTQAEQDQRMSLIRPSLELSAAQDADIVIEAVFERMEVKQDLFRRLDQLLKPGAILASNTSTLDLNAIAAVTGRPQDVIGLHFFSPANVMRLLEIVRGKRTGKDVLATALKLGKRLKKVPVVSGVCDGFIGNRMLERYVQQTLCLLDEGAAPEQVDAALQRFGMAMGPFAVYDLAGNDIGWEIRKRRAREHPGLARPSFADVLCELGRFGQKTGQGWYRYEPGSRQPQPDPEVARLLGEHRARLGLAPRAIADEEIVARCVFALVNEGAHILEEGIALRASDIDVVYLNGYGFPAFRGGPMFYASTLGLSEVRADIEAFSSGYQGELWKPAPLLVRLAQAAQGFEA